MKYLKKSDYTVIGAMSTQPLENFASLTEDQFLDIELHQKSPAGEKCGLTGFHFLPFPILLPPII